MLSKRRTKRKIPHPSLLPTAATTFPKGKAIIRKKPKPKKRKKFMTKNTTKSFYSTLPSLRKPT